MKNIIENTLTQTKETQTTLSPKEALMMLKEGNERFIASSMLKRNLKTQVHETGGGQYPFATVLGCIDSRVPSELIFDQGIGDIFNARIAGNFVNKDIIGSLEFACKVAGSKAIVVLGHSSCGAVKGACDGVKLGNLTHTLSNLKPAVELVVDEFKDRSSANPGFVQKVADMNVKLTIKKIKEQSPILREMYQNGEITIVGAMYEVASGEVKWFD